MGKRTISDKSKIIVVTGPTSSGKSETAINLAKKFKGEVISADSRQVYRNFDLGSGKIKGKWSKLKKAFISEKVPHYLIDIASPKSYFSVYNFVKQAQIKIIDIQKRNKLPIICGGTGFWISALIEGTKFPKVAPNKKLRRRLAKYSTEKLYKLLQSIDQKRAKEIDSKNKVRIIRSIEIANELGHVPKIINSQTLVPNKNILILGIQVDRKKLAEDIKKRLLKRFRSGLVAEIAKLRQSGISWKRIENLGLSARPVVLYLKGKISKSEMKKMAYKEELAYVKKQITWWKKKKYVRWLKSYKEIEKTVKNFISE